MLESIGRLFVVTIFEQGVHKNRGTAQKDVTRQRNTPVTLISLVCRLKQSCIILALDHFSKLSQNAA
jgi:hypothetical protein